MSKTAWMNLFFETKGTTWKSALSTRKPALRNCISILWITWLVIYSQCTEYELLYRKTRHVTNKPSKILYEQALMDWLIDWCIMRLLSHGCYPRVYDVFARALFFSIFILFLTRHASSITAVCLSHFQKKSLCDWICLIRNFFQSAPKYCIWLRAWRGPIRLVSPIFKL